MAALEWIGLGLLAAVVLATTLLERRLERRERRSAWGELLWRDRLGRTLYVPFGTTAYVVRDPAVIGRVERLCARGFAMLEAGAVGFAAIALVLAAVSWHALIAPLAIVAVAGWALLIGWSIRQARQIARALHPAS